MSIDTLKFVKEATANGFSKEQAEFLANEAKGFDKEKVGNEYLDIRLKQLSNEIIIRLGGLMVVGMGVLGFILKH